MFIVNVAVCDWFQGRNRDAEIVGKQATYKKEQDTGRILTSKQRKEKRKGKKKKKEVRDPACFVGFRPPQSLFFSSSIDDVLQKKKKMKVSGPLVAYVLAASTVALTSSSPPKDVAFNQVLVFLFLFSFLIL